MILIYQLGIFCYNFLIKIASNFNQKAKKIYLGRKETFVILEKNKLEYFEKQSVIWFHCASLGEFEQARPVLEGFKKNYLDFKILLTFFSPSGYEIQKNYPCADVVVYLPSDNKENAQKLLQIVKPKIVFFAKYEFWHFYLSEIKKQNIPCVLFSAIFRENQVFFRFYGGFYRKMLDCFSSIFVQNNHSKILLTTILSENQLKNVFVGGDTRFDRVKAICEAKKEIIIAEKFKNKQPLLIIGSSWDEDLAVLVPFMNNFALPLKIIIAPHEINQQKIKELRQKINKKTTPFSENFSENTSENISENDILIIDNVGMLSSLYAYADFAFVGGGFKQGLHNILEAATFGLPIFFGNKKYQKYQEATDLITQKGAFAVANTQDFERQFLEIYQNKVAHEQAQKACLEYVNANLGATKLILEKIKI